jgi:formiminotetrahydrofolate cyclodeaminase
MHIGYYPNVLVALKKIVDKELSESGAKEASDLIAKIEEVNKQISDLYGH